MHPKIGDQLGHFGLRIGKLHHGVLFDRGIVLVG